MTLQPSKTWMYLTWSCLQVTSSMNLCRLQDLISTRSKNTFQTLILWTLNCFNKAICPSFFFSALTVFSNETLFTVVCLKQLQSRHWSNIKKRSQHIQFCQQLLWAKVSPFFSIEYINIYSNKWRGGEMFLCSRNSQVTTDLEVTYLKLWTSAHVSLGGPSTCWSGTDHRIIQASALV